MTKKKSLTLSTQGANVAKLFPSLLTMRPNKLECLSLASLSSLAAGKTRSLPKSGEPERCLTRVGSCLTRKH